MFWACMIFMGAMLWGVKDCPASAGKLFLTQLAVIGAAVTKHIGFGVTAGVPFEHPYPFARRLSTLDHLTKGRIGWNIVTGYLPSANKNMGSSELPHNERYDVADEYMEVIYKLLEGSWEDSAVILDRESGDFADPSKIHHIGHHGKYFDVPGIHLCEPSIQRTRCYSKREFYAW